jgi:hypothetical protein
MVRFFGSASARSVKRSAVEISPPGRPLLQHETSLSAPHALFACSTVIEASVSRGKRLESCCGRAAAIVMRVNEMKARMLYAVVQEGLKKGQIIIYGCIPMSVKMLRIFPCLRYIPIWELGGNSPEGILLRVWNEQWLVMFVIIVLDGM